jgi:hypothetical protein
LIIEVEADVALALSSVGEVIALPLIAWGSLEADGETLRVIPVGQLGLVQTCRRRRLKQFEPVEGGGDWWGDLFEVIGLAFTPIERTLWRLDEGRSVSTAVGVQLEGVGSVVDRQRVGLTDDLYRAAIKVDGIGLFGAGTREDMVAAAVALWGDRYLGIVEVWPAAQRLFAVDLTEAEFRLALDLLGEVRGGTVGTVLEVWTSMLYGVGYEEDGADVIGWTGYLGEAAEETLGYVGYARVTS